MALNAANYRALMQNAQAKAAELRALEPATSSNSQAYLKIIEMAGMVPITVFPLSPRDRFEGLL